MGMFDEVNYECTCPVCKGVVSGFQTKDGDCTLEVVPISSITKFYSICPRCGCWIEFKRKEGSTFTRKVRSLKKWKNRGEILEHTKDIKVEE